MTIFALWFAAISTAIFPIVYTLLAPWWRSMLGRILFGGSTLLALYFLAALRYMVTGEGMFPLVSVSLVLIGVNMLMLSAMLVREQWRRTGKM